MRRSSRSNFSKYFRDHFKELGLRKLISTCYIDQQTELFEPPPDTPQGEIVTSAGTSRFSLKSSGDFRDWEARQYFQEADIICTNPPFSLVRALFAQMMKFQNQFLVIAPLFAMAYRVLSRYVISGQVRQGVTMRSGNTWFDCPDGSEEPIGNTSWITNLDHNQWPPYIVLTEGNVK